MPRLLRTTRARAGAASLLAIAAITTAAYATVAGSASQPVQRTVYGPAAPQNAPGQSLALQEVVIAPGAKLAEHFHEGTQLATVRSGVLTYNVVSGAVVVTRAGGHTETFTGPAVVKLHQGDTIVETQSLVHYGANDGKVPVVVELASLLRTGAPLATPVGPGDPGATKVHVEATLASQSRVLHQVGADGQFTYGWNQLTGTATTAGGPVAVELLGAVDYTSGSGPFSGFVTFTYADGSTLAVSMQGLARAGTDGSTSFTATLGVVGGTGKYAGATGSGTFTGSRTTALGGKVSATFDVELAQQ